MTSLALAFDILAHDRGASKTFRDVGDAARTTGDKADKASRQSGNFGTALGGLAKVAAGAFAALGAGRMFAGFIADAAESAKIGRLTNAVIKSTGGVANVTAAGVDKLATALSNKTAVDDETIQNSANVLLTFTKVRNEVGKGNNVFDKATEAALNMSAALGGDLQGATTMVGKALNDPIKGITALTRAGVQFTDQQKDQIRALVEAGDTLGAQKIILEELETQFGGAAEAAADPMERLKVVMDNLGENIGAKILPSVEKFSTFLTDKLIPGAEQVFDVLFKGEYTGGPLAEDSWVIRTAGTLRDLFFDIRDGAGQAFDILFRGDYSGGPFAEDSKFVGTLTGVRDAFMDIGTFIRDELVPRFETLAAWWDEDGYPAFDAVRTFVADELRPTFEQLADTWDTQVKPALGDLRDAFEKNKPAIQDAAKVLGAVAGVLALIQFTGIAKTLPFLVELGGFMVTLASNQIQFLLTAFSGLVDWLKDTVRWIGDTADGFGRLMDKLDKFKLPSWIQSLVDAVKSIAGGVGTAAGGIVKFFGGDAPASFRGSVLGGGPALARVRSALPPGLAVTSTFRTAEQNRAAGGYPTSLHMDRNNPAVDIAGPTALLDRFANVLAGMGGWRQLLWRVPGHQDHIHVAHNGGVVSSSWPRMPGDRWDERTVRTQVGETITPKGASVGGQMPSEVNLSAESVWALADAILAGSRNVSVGSLRVAVGRGR